MRILVRFAKCAVAAAAVAAVMFQIINPKPASAGQEPAGADAISAGRYHTCALKDGGVKCWGSNAYGQLGDGTTTNRLTPVAVSGLTSGVVTVTAGTFHTCALTSAGVAHCWGINSWGQLGNGTATFSFQPTPLPVQVVSPPQPPPITYGNCDPRCDDVPTLPEWGMIFMSIGLMVTAMLRQRRTRSSL